MAKKLNILDSFITKLSILFACVFTIILLCFCFYNHDFIKSYMLENLESQSENIINRLSESLLEPIWKLDREVYLGIIESELLNDSISAITLLSKKKEVVMVLGKNEKGEIVDLKGGADNFDYTYEKRKLLEYDAYGKTRDLGEVIVYVSDKKIQEHLRSILHREIIEILILDILATLFLVLILKRVVGHPLSNINKALSHIADGGGNLRNKLDDTSKNELGVLSSTFNKFVSGLQGTIKTAVTYSQELSHISEQTSSDAKQAYADLEREKEEISNLAHVANNMALSATLIAENAEKTANSTKNAYQESSKGKELVDDIAIKMNELLKNVEGTSFVVKELGERAERIDYILDVIRNVSEQTNLLALNAAIEAARAGEAGRGFSVVADEVRALSLRTQKATDDIQEMITSLHGSSEKATNIINSSKENVYLCAQQVAVAGESLAEISSSVRKILGMSVDIANAAEEQSIASKDIRSNVDNITNLIDSSFEVTESSKIGARRSKNLSRDLKDLMDKFEV